LSEVVGRALKNLLIQKKCLWWINFGHKALALLRQLYLNQNKDILFSYCRFCRPTKGLKKHLFVLIFVTLKVASHADGLFYKNRLWMQILNGQIWQLFLRP